MTKREAAIVSAYTGVMLGNFTDMHQYIEEVLDRPVFIHELGSEKVAEEVKEATRADFISIKVEG